MTPSIIFRSYGAYSVILRPTGYKYFRPYGTKAVFLKLCWHYAQQQRTNRAHYRAAKTLVEIRRRVVLCALT